MLEHIYEMNLNYLLLVRRVAREEESRLSQLGISSEAAHWIRSQPMARIAKLARSSFLICRMNVSSSEILLALARSQIAQSVTLARSADELTA
ncbi:flagellar transcriptional regulator FlhD [Achromobacter sp.]|uniref:flagellar transcriptional regulator FlhD n=1 Tax=Achromobacter sp. TaxID=134375 RepID=UPI003D01A38E